MKTMSPDRTQGVGRAPHLPSKREVGLTLIVLASLVALLLITGQHHCDVRSFLSSNGAIGYLRICLGSAVVFSGILSGTFHLTRKESVKNPLKRVSTQDIPTLVILICFGLALILWGLGTIS